jgi:hypothetical protein
MLLKLGLFLLEEEMIPSVLRNWSTRTALVVKDLHRPQDLNFHQRRSLVEKTWSIIKKNFRTSKTKIVR